jgi:5'-nucleotidase
MLSGTRSARLGDMTHDQQHEPSTAMDDTFVLGVDLDGVCADYTGAFRAVVAADAGVDPDELGEQTHWEFDRSGWPVRDRDHFMDLHKQAVVEQRLFATMGEIDGASDTLWRLSDAGVYIRIITHRLVVNWGHDIAVGDTVSWLQAPRSDGRPRIPYRDVCFCANKAEVGADAYIDDAPHNIAALRLSARANDVICFDAPYNRHVPGLRAHNWGEVETLILQRLDERAALAQL